MHSLSRSERVQDRPVSKSKEVPREWWGYDKKTHGAIKGSPSGQMWDHWSNIRRVTDYNLLKSGKNPRAHSDINKQMGEKRELFLTVQSQPMNAE